MADIIDMKITVHGQITTAAAFDALVKAIGKNLHHLDSPKQMLLDANLADEGLVIEAESYNGDIEEITKAAIKHKIDMTVVSGEGPGWGASTYFIRDGRASFELPLIEDKIAVTLDVIDDLKKRGITTLDELAGFINIFAESENQPRFTVADEVITEMFLPKRKR